MMEDNVTIVQFFIFYEQFFFDFHQFYNKSKLIFLIVLWFNENKTFYCTICICMYV